MRELAISQADHILLLQKELVSQINSLHENLAGKAVELQEGLARNMLNAIYKKRLPATIVSSIEALLAESEIYRNNLIATVKFARNAEMPEWLQISVTFQYALVNITGQVVEYDIDIEADDGTDGQDSD